MSLLCFFTGHVWWEHWQFKQIDHCIRCHGERPHKTEGCCCTICKSPGGYEVWMIMRYLLK